MVPSIAVMPREGNFALAFFGRIRKVQESPFSLSAGRKSFALKRIDAVLVIWLAPLIDRNVLLGRIISELTRRLTVGETVRSSGESDWMLHGVPIVFPTALITPEEATDGRRIEGHRVAARPTNSS